MLAILLVDEHATLSLRMHQPCAWLHPIAIRYIVGFPFCWAPYAPTLTLAHAIYSHTCAYTYECLPFRYACTTLLFLPYSKLTINCFYHNLFVFV